MVLEVTGTVDTLVRGVAVVVAAAVVVVVVDTVVVAAIVGVAANCDGPVPKVGLVWRLMGINRPRVAP